MLLRKEGELSIGDRQKLKRSGKCLVPVKPLHEYPTEDAEEKKGEEETED